MTRALLVATCLLFAAPGLSHAMSSACSDALVHVDMSVLDDQIETQKQLAKAYAKQLTDADQDAAGRAMGERSNARLAAVRKGCRKGETISIPSSEARIIQNVCDFNKQILKDGGRVTCVVR